ncbi:MAG: ECF-type sigma factor [Bacteroidota bacterium]
MLLPTQPSINNRAGYLPTAPCPLASSSPLHVHVDAGYAVLCRCAKALLRREKRAQLTPKALVHEAYLRLATRWQHRVNDQTHAIALMYRAMRQVLLDRVRARQRVKRPQPGQVVSLETLQIEHMLAAPTSTCAMSDVLGLLAQRSAAQAEAIQLTYLQGYTNAEVAQRQQVSYRTAKRRKRNGLMVLRQLLTERPNHIG